MAVNHGMLYRIDKIQGKVVEQLVVPGPYRRTVLNLAHTHPLGERVVQSFFWPGIHADVKNDCESCPECQKAAPTPHYRSPLVPLTD